MEVVRAGDLVAFGMNLGKPTEPLVWAGRERGKVILTPCFVALTSLRVLFVDFRPGNTPWGSSAFPVSRRWQKMFPTTLPKKYRRDLWESLQVREKKSWRTPYGEQSSSADSYQASCQVPLYFLVELE